MRPLLTLTTDFGTGSAYVAQVKGVILSLCREVDLVDVSHAISAQNVREGAVVLADATPRFPEGTLHLAVVDPGVGTRRRILYAEIGNQRYLAPDNGLLSLLVRQHPLRSLRVVDQPQYWLPKVSPTFHGRDIFAPVAAHLSRGVRPAEMGPPLSHPVMLPWADAVTNGRLWRGSVQFIDDFGNIITNIPALPPPSALVKVVINNKPVGVLRWVRTYSDGLPGQWLGLASSDGFCEIAEVNGHAARSLVVDEGATVEWEWQ